MSKVQDETKLTGCDVGLVGKPQQQHQQQRRRSQRSSTRRKQTGNGNQLAVLDAVAGIHFADDFAEYMARAESGGSTYGVLRRRAFAQTSLRIRRPATGDDNDNDGVNNTRLAVSRQRRSRSLVPPPRRRSGEHDPSLPNHKTLLQALCAQTQQQQQQQQQQQSKPSDKLQVNTTGKYITN